MSAATLEHTTVRAAHRLLYIGGEWRDGSTHATLPVEDPATGEILCEVADATSADAVAALDAAAAAQPAWARARRSSGRTSSPRLPGDVRQDGRAGPHPHARGGKPLLESRARSPTPRSTCASSRGGAEARRRLRTQPGRPGPRPRDAPAGRPVPGHHTLELPAGDGRAGHRAGPRGRCTLVVKSSRQTPLSTIALADIMERAGPPARVLNIIVSSSSGAVTTPLIEDPRLRKLTFTGSTEVGPGSWPRPPTGCCGSRWSWAATPPFLVFDDADLEAAVEGAVLAKMRNCGQACTSANRFLVAEPVVEEFTARLSARLPGSGSPGHRARRSGRSAHRRRPVRPARELVEDALARGARVVMGAACMLGRGTSTRRRARPCPV